MFLFSRSRVDIVNIKASAMEASVHYLGVVGLELGESADEVAVPTASFFF